MSTYARDVQEEGALCMNMWNARCLRPGNEKWKWRESISLRFGPSFRPGEQYFQYPLKQHLTCLKWGRQPGTYRLHHHGTNERESSCGTLLFFLSYRGPCEAARLVRSQPPGKMGYKVTPPPSKIDDELSTLGRRGDHIADERLLYKLLGRWIHSGNARL